MTRTPKLIIRHLKYDHRFTHLLTSFQAKAKLCDLRNRMKNRSDQVTLDEFRKSVGDDEEAIKNRDKRMAFGEEYCNPKEWKFVWKAFDKEVSTQTLVNSLFFIFCFPFFIVRILLMLLFYVSL